MAEVVGTVTAIVPFAIQATIILYQTIQSLDSRARLIRGLGEELQDLQEALQNLQELLSDSDIDLTALKGPLERCTSACNDFRKAVIECTQHSSGDRYSKRDWLKIRFMGGDISDFRNMLAGYKSTITIALAYANLFVIPATPSVTISRALTFIYLVVQQGSQKVYLKNIRSTLRTHKPTSKIIFKIFDHGWKPCHSIARQERMLMWWSSKKWKRRSKALKKALISVISFLL
jgi:hypothetical protein